MKEKKEKCPICLKGFKGERGTTYDFEMSGGQQVLKRYHAECLWSTGELGGH